MDDIRWVIEDSRKAPLKFGGEFRYLQINERNVCAPNGDFTFDGMVTGVDFADYLLGRPTAAAGYNQCSSSSWIHVHAMAGLMCRT